MRRGLVVCLAGLLSACAPAAPPAPTTVQWDTAAAQEAKQAIEKLMALIG